MPADRAGQRPALGLPAAGGQVVGAVGVVDPDQLLLDTRRNPFALTSVTLNNYRYLLTETEFPRWIWNTMVVTVGATALSLVCSILIGYALGRFQFRGGNTIGRSIRVSSRTAPRKRWRARR